MLPEHAYTALLEHIGHTFAVARGKAYVAMNQQLLEAYWNIGRHIVEFEQKGYGKAVYGKKLIQQLSRDLSLKFGKGFSMTNLYSMRQFFEAYPISQTLSAKLTWSHVTELVDISDPLARSFYEKQCANEGWSVRQLKRLEIPILLSRYGGVAAGIGGGDGGG